MSKSLEDIEAEIAALERAIEEEPRRLQREREREEQLKQERLSTLAPSDELVSQRIEKRHNAVVTHGETNTIRKAQSRDAILLILLLIAIGAMAWWLFSSLNASA